MRINLNFNDQIRVSDSNNPFEECNFVDICNDRTFSATVYEMHKIIIVRKSRTIKTFFFDKNKKVVHNKELGYYSDGQILFSNIELL